jgi:hypothetical protein
MLVDGAPLDLIAGAASRAPIRAPIRKHLRYLRLGKRSFLATVEF